MAFIADNFSPVGGTHGPGLLFGGTEAIYSYITADSLSTVLGGGYFNELRDIVFTRDWVFVGSSQLDDDSSDNEYTMIFFNAVPRSPLTTNVTTRTDIISAT